MANVNLTVNSGETKTITFNSGGKFTTEDIVFTVTGGNGNSSHAFEGASYSSNLLNICGVASGKRSYTFCGSLTASSTITLKYSQTENLLTEHYALFKADSALNLSSITFKAMSLETGRLVTLIKPEDLNVGVPAGNYVELSFIPIAANIVVMTVSNILK